MYAIISHQVNYKIMDCHHRLSRIDALFSYCSNLMLC